MNLCRKQQILHYGNIKYQPRAKQTVEVLYNFHHYEKSTIAVIKFMTCESEITWYVTYYRLIEKFFFENYLFCQSNQYFLMSYEPYFFGNFVTKQDKSEFPGLYFLNDREKNIALLHVLIYYYINKQGQICRILKICQILQICRTCLLLWKSWLEKQT